MASQHWLTTAPNPRSAATGYNAGQNGWALHLVESDATEFSALGKGPKAVRSLCGLRPRHGWSLDMFIDAKCERCVAALKKRSKS